MTPTRTSLGGRLSGWLAPLFGLRLPPVQTALLCAAALLIAAALQQALIRPLGAGGSFVTFVPAILAAATLGGLPAATAVFVLSSAYTWFFMLPGPPQNLRGVIVFVVCVGVTGFVSALLKEVFAQIVAEREALRLSEENYRVREALSPVMLWEADPAGNFTSVGKGFRHLTGTDGDPTDSLHAEDAEALQAAWRRSLQSGTPFEAEHRMETVKGVRWFRARAYPHRDASGQIVKWYGATEDIHERKAAEEARTLLMREVDHRARNVLSVVQALVNLSRRSDVDSYAQAVQARVHALARVHTLLAESRWQGGDLRDLLEQEFAAYSGHVTLEGPDVLLAPAVVQPLGLIVHELATNAAKYGALSAETGTVTLSWVLEGDALRLDWRERGGPELSGEPASRGFGSRLIRNSLSKDRGDSIAFDWTGEGLGVHITIQEAAVPGAEASAAAE